jgi:hypothetical protein
MKASVQYLHDAKIEELVSRFESQGFQVIREPEEGFDLVVIRNGKRIVYEIKVQSELVDSADRIKRLREKAFEKGYNEFHLVMVYPPKEKDVYINGLDSKLFNYITKNMPDDLMDLSSGTIIDEVVDIDIDSLEIESEKLHVIGTGSVGVTIENGLGSNFPLSFDIILDNDLNIHEAAYIKVDTSSFCGHNKVVNEQKIEINS